MDSTRWAVLSLMVAVLGCRSVEKEPGPPAAGEPGAGLSAEELKILPLKTDLPGKPPKSGLRYWAAPFESIGVGGAYVSVVIRDGKYELWHNTWGEIDVTDKQMVVNRGPDILHLGKAETVFDATMINDVFDPKDPAQLSAERGFTRPYVLYDGELGYILFSCNPPGYYPGSVPLLPALATSKTGEPGSWAYKGKIKGEPLDEAAKRTIWSDGGSLHRLDDGRWRIYLNGFGPVAAALESNTLDGPWAFVRDKAGAIRELLPDFPKGPNAGGCFPTVLRVAKDEWHFWLTDTWPPQSIWHFWSKDGLTWKLYGKQPEITRAAVGWHGIKCLRAYLDPAGKEIVGLLSVWGTNENGKPGWVLHVSRMPVGKP